MANGPQSDVLARLREEGGAAFVAALAALLARTAPARLALISHGAATDDRVPVVRAAHSLRASAANLGAVELAAAAEAMERLAASPADWQDAAAREAAVAAVGHAWSEVADSIRRLAAPHVE